YSIHRISWRRALPRGRDKRRLPALRSPKDGREHVTLQHNLAGDLRPAVGAGIHRHHEVQSGHDIEPLAAVADAGDPADLAAVDQEASEPPKIAVEKDAFAVDVGCGRGRDPFRPDDRPALPGAAIEHELADLGEIAGAQAQSAIAADVATGESGPLHIGDGE